MYRTGRLGRYPCDAQTLRQVPEGEEMQRRVRSPEQSNQHRVFPTRAMVCLTPHRVYLTLTQVCLTLTPGVSITRPRPHGVSHTRPRTMNVPEGEVLRH